MQLGCGDVLVSGNELRLALHAGFDPTKYNHLHPLVLISEYASGSALFFFLVLSLFFNSMK